MAMILPWIVKWISQDALKPLLSSELALRLYPMLFGRKAA
jgi:hypothetical protein